MQLSCLEDFNRDVEQPWLWNLQLITMNPSWVKQLMQGQQLNQIQEKRLIKEESASTTRFSQITKREIIILKRQTTFLLPRIIQIHTFLSTISRGSCSATFGSLRKKVSFSTLSFKLRISIKCMVSTSLFWKYSANDKNQEMRDCQR